MASRTTRWIWLALLGVAFVTRLAVLGQVPLAPSEAVSALTSLDAAAGTGWPTITPAPLIVVGNALLFLLAGPGDGVARLLPALTGVAWVGIPWLWRKRIGERGALAAASLLLLSPLGLFASRRVDGLTAGILGASLILSAWALDEEAAHSRFDFRASLLVLGVAIGLTGGPAFYDLLLPGVAAGLLYLGLTDRRISLTPLNRWRTPLLGGLIGALLISVGLGFRWSGWAGIAEGLAAWFAPSRPFHANLSPLFLLTLYEPAAVVLAVLGLASAIRHDKPVGQSLAMATVLTLLIISLRMPEPLTVSAAVIPLALLAGLGFEELTDIPSDRRLYSGLYALLAAVCWIPAALGLTQIANGFLRLGEGWLVLGSVAVLIAMQCLLAMLFTLLLPSSALWRSALAGIVLIWGIVQAGFAFNLAFIRATSPTEPALTAVTSPDLWALRAALEDLAVLQRHRRDSFPVTVIDDDPELTAVLRWTLRDFRALQVSPGWPESQHGVVLTTPNSRAAPREEAAWVGRSFVAIVHDPQPPPTCRWNSTQPCRALLAWYLYRTPAAPPIAQPVLMWRTQSDAFTR